MVASRSLGGREDPSVAGDVDAGSEPRPRRGTPITAITLLGSFSVHSGAQLCSFGDFHQILVHKYTFHSIVQAYVHSRSFYSGRHTNVAVQTIM